MAESPATVRALAQFVVDTGYTEERMKEFGLTRIPWRGSEVRPLLSWKVPEDSALGLLTRLFFFGEGVPSNLLFASFPTEIANGMVKTGMLRQENDHLIPDCMLVHFGKLLLACDSVRRVQAGALNDLVLGVNKPTHILRNCMLNLPNAGNVLDLGTGCGTLAFEAAPNAQRVIGTDINERALKFANFNAALNGVANFEARGGDRFGPVKDERFDLVVCNPPFFLTPSSKLLFTDNPFILDSFVESLARQAPGFLKQGGYFQMLCEWVEMKGQPWPDRLRDWFGDSGCGVLVLKAYEISPSDYVLKRTAESASLYGESSQKILIDHVKYFNERGVGKIYGGLITIRRPAFEAEGNSRSKNWFVTDEMDEIPGNQFGDVLMDRFAAEDVLASQSNSRLLSAKPRLSKDVILVQEAVQENRSWKPKMIYLERRTGLVRRLGFSSEIAGLVANWDGSQDLDFLAAAFARQKNLPKKQVAQDFLGLARRLAALGLITFAGS
jgi:predicted RNA methylase